MEACSSNLTCHDKHGQLIDLGIDYLNILNYTLKTRMVRSWIFTCYRQEAMDWWHIQKFKSNLALFEITWKGDLFLRMGVGIWLMRPTSVSKANYQNWGAKLHEQGGYGTNDNISLITVEGFWIAKTNHSRTSDAESAACLLRLNYFSAIISNCSLVEF